MTWPFENDTSAIVKKLAKRNLAADKTRNILIVMTIAFAACLIMATALYAIGTQRASRSHAAGMYQANISGLNDETARAIHRHPGSQHRPTATLPRQKAFCVCNGLGLS